MNLNFNSTVLRSKLPILPNAFTLVELVVVITILAILWTIWFVAYSWFSSKARDSNRLAQLDWIYNWLELYKINYKLPLPDNKVDIYLNWTLVWYQWEAWDTVLSAISYQKWWKDPLDMTYYTYSINKKQNQSQLLAFMENQSNTTAMNSILLDNVNAVDYTERIIEVLWAKLWILLDTLNNPIEDDISLRTSGLYLTSTSTWNYKVVLSTQTSSWIIVSSWSSLLTQIYQGSTSSQNWSLVSLNCIWIPTNAVYYNNSTSYSWSNISSLTAVYKQNPTTWSCEYKCTVWLPIWWVCSCPSGATCETNSMKYLTSWTYAFTLSWPITVSAVAVWWWWWGWYNWSTPGWAWWWLSRWNWIAFSSGQTVTVVVWTPWQWNTTSQTVWWNTTLTAWTQLLTAYWAGQWWPGSDTTWASYWWGYAAANISWTVWWWAWGNSTSTYHAWWAGWYTGRWWSSNNQNWAWWGWWSPNSYSSTYWMSAWWWVWIYWQWANWLAWNSTSGAPAYWYGWWGWSTSNNTWTNWYAWECSSLWNGRGWNNLIQWWFPGWWWGWWWSWYGWWPWWWWALRIIWWSGSSFPSNAS